MNWYSSLKIEPVTITEKTFAFDAAQKLTKVAYSSKKHDVEVADTDDNDAYRVKVALTESKKGIVLTVNIMSEVYSFPSYSETWKYDKKESNRAFKTYNRCVNVLEDIKIDHEDNDLSGPSLQGLVREGLRYVDIDRKKETNNRSLEAAKYQNGESDWKSSLYGNRLSNPVINISNSGEGIININGL